MTAVAEAVRQRWSLSTVAALHLAPGAASLIGYTVFARIVTAGGLPNSLGLMLATLLVEAPAIWWLMNRLVRSEGGTLNWQDLFPWDKRLSPLWYVGGGLLSLIWGFVMISIIAPAFQVALAGTLFGWLPDWFVLGIDAQAMFAQPPSVLAAIWALSVLMALAAGSSQELYFRGFLLPRMSHMGGFAPIANAMLFAIFHLIAPWNWIPFFVGTLPWSILMWRKRSIRLTLIIHVGMLLFQSLLMGLVVFGLAAVPA